MAAKLKSIWRKADLYRTRPWYLLSAKKLRPSAITAGCSMVSSKLQRFFVLVLQISPSVQMHAILIFFLSPNSSRSQSGVRYRNCIVQQFSKREISKFTPEMISSYEIFRFFLITRKSFVGVRYRSDVVNCRNHSFSWTFHVKFMLLSGLDWAQWILDINVANYRFYNNDKNDNNKNNNNNDKRFS